MLSRTEKQPIFQGYHSISQLSDAERNTNCVLERVEKVTWRDLRDGCFTAELKRLICFAAPMAGVFIIQFMTQIIPIVMVGHLGNLYLASASFAISFCTVTGFSFIIGLTSALDTLSGQAYGAKLYRKVGVQTYTAMFCLTLVCHPLSLLWFHMGKLLVILGQDPSIAYEAGRYAVWLIPGLFAYAISQPLTRYLRNQSLITPLVTTYGLVFCLHVPICWILVYKSGLGYLGGALAHSLSNWLCAIFLGSFMYYSSACSETRAPLTMEIFDGVGEFFRYALPSAAMVCLEWWSYELIILLSGLLPNPQLETSVLCVCHNLEFAKHNIIQTMASLQTATALYKIPLSISAAASTRISNELGAGNWRAAHIVVYAAMFLAVMDALIMSTSLLVCRNLFGHVFSSDKKTIDYVAKMAPLVSISLILDSIQGVLSGIARGCGWQHIGAYINLGAYYLLGMPIAASLAFWVHMKGVGLWVGIQVGSVIQTLLLALFTSFTNWENQALEARKRMTVTHEIELTES